MSAPDVQIDMAMAGQPVRWRLACPAMRRAKLALWREAARLRAEGVSLDEIGQRFGRGREGVRRWLRNAAKAEEMSP